MRGTQLARQWKILRFVEFRKRGFTARDPAEKLEALSDLYESYEDLSEHYLKAFHPVDN